MGTLKSTRTSARFPRTSSSVRSRTVRFFMKDEGADGAALVTDMPKGIGGGASAPTPGWFLRAALANCDATVIAMRAAQLGVLLTRLEVTVDSVSDTRGMLGQGAGITAGPQSMRMKVSIGASNASAEQLREIVAWAEVHSPVGDAIKRAIPITVDVTAH